MRTTPPGLNSHPHSVRIRACACARIHLIEIRLDEIRLRNGQLGGECAVIDGHRIGTVPALKFDGLPRNCNSNGRPSSSYVLRGPRQTAMDATLLG